MTTTNEIFNIDFSGAAHREPVGSIGFQFQCFDAAFTSLSTALIVLLFDACRVDMKRDNMFSIALNFIVVIY